MVLAHCLPEKLEAEREKKRTTEIKYLKTTYQGIVHEDVDHFTLPEVLAESKRCKAAAAAAATEAVGARLAASGRGGTSHFKGVTWNKQNSKWVAKIRIDGKQSYLGYFVEEEEAARAYDVAAERMGKPTNFPAAASTDAVTTAVAPTEKAPKKCLASKKRPHSEIVTPPV
jgi:hypothetical protein